MQPPSDSHQPHASAEERIAEQAREIQQLARASVKEGPTLPPLPPLCVPELNKAIKRPQPQWMRLIVSNLKAHVRLRAGEVGEVPRPAEFKGIRKEMNTYHVVESNVFLSEERTATQISLPHHCVS